MNLTLNPTDYDNIVANVGPPPAKEGFVVTTDESIERGFARVSQAVEGDDPQVDTVPLFVVGIPAEAAMSEAEAAEYQQSSSDVLEQLLATLGETLVVEMNTAEYARAVQLFGPPPNKVDTSDDIEIGCSRINGELRCDPSTGIKHGVLGRADDGSLFVTSDVISV